MSLHPSELWCRTAGLEWSPFTCRTPGLYMVVAALDTEPVALQMREASWCQSPGTVLVWHLQTSGPQGREILCCLVAVYQMHPSERSAPGCVEKGIRAGRHGLWSLSGSCCADLRTPHPPEHSRVPSLCNWLAASAGLLHSASVTKC